MLLAGWLSACTATAYPVIPESRVDGVREDPAGVLEGNVPAGLFDGVWRHWWSKTEPGARILYSESVTSPASGRAEPLPAFGPTRDPKDFDGKQTGDISVIAIGDVYFMYYGGRPLPGSPYPLATAIGCVASHGGPDHSAREYPRPILEAYAPGTFPSSPDGGPDRDYGVGRPCAIWLDDWVYLFYNDTTAPASNPRTGAGIYCIRSTDAFFKVNVQEFTRKGFVDRESTRHLTRDYSLADANWADFQYIKPKKQFVMLHHRQPGMASFRFFNKDLKYLPRHDMNIPVERGDGEGRFIRGTNGSALPHGSGGTAFVSLIWYYAGPPAAEGSDHGPPPIRYTRHRHQGEVTGLGETGGIAEEGNPELELPPSQEYNRAPDPTSAVIPGRDRFKIGRGHGPKQRQKS